MDALINFKVGIIANIDSLSSQQLKKALKKRGLAGSQKLSSLQKRAKTFNKAFIRRVKSNKPEHHIREQPTLFEQPEEIKYVWKDSTPNFASWHLKFDGTTDVRAFLNNVEVLSISRNITYETVARCFNELLTGMALKWFLSLPRESLSWRELTAVLINKFEPGNIKFARRMEVLTAKQMHGKTAQDFFTDTRLRNRNLENPISEQELVEVFKNGLLPQYASVLSSQPNSSATELENACTSFERYQKPIARPIREQRNYLNSLASSSQAGPSGDNNSGRVCYYCKRAGHYRNTCDLYRNSKNGTPLPRKQIEYNLPMGIDFSKPPPKLNNPKN